MINNTNSLYIFNGLLNYYSMKDLTENFSGEISVDADGFFKDGRFMYGNDNIECRILGHVKNKDSVMQLSFIMALDDRTTVDLIFDLSNITGNYNPLTKNLEGHYVGKWCYNMNASSLPFNPDMMNNYSKFEKLMNSAEDDVRGDVRMDLIKKFSLYLKTFY